MIDYGNRSVFLYELCPYCSGRLFRYLECIRRNDDTTGHGSERLGTRVFDACGGCNRLVRDSTELAMTVVSLKEEFDRFARGESSRTTFDKRVAERLCSAGGYLHKVVRADHDDGAIGILGEPCDSSSPTKA